jgi:voltage-gated potassium channel Kch
VNALRLLGRAHGEIGAVAVENAGRCAVAISRGGAQKRYDHTDPNEDAALAVEGARGALVAVADGHWGTRAAEIAIAQLADVHAADWLDGESRTPERWYQDVLHALVALNDAILASHAGDDTPRTTLALALARPADGVLVTASVGDSLLFVAGERQVLERLPRPRTASFLGSLALKPSQLARAGRIETYPLADARALVAVTDGLSEHNIGVDDPRETVKQAIAAADAAKAGERAAVAARGVVDAAVAAHKDNDAGDNVAASVVWLANG